MLNIDGQANSKKAFSSIQNCALNAEILQNLVFKESFYSFTDASDKVHSGVLLQERNGKYVTINMFDGMFNDKDTVR